MKSDGMKSGSAAATHRNISALTGFMCCFGMVMIGIATNGGIRTILNFIHIPSMIVTFGGSLFALMITSESFQDFTDGLTSFARAFSKPNNNLDNIGEEIYEMAQIARKEGLLVLEEKMETIEDSFMAKGIRLIIDGSDPELVKDILEMDLLHHVEDNHRRISFWANLGSYGPAWGMVGTLLGLINMMKSMGSDPGAVGEGMSLALLTTLYGSLLANWVCIPIAEKLRKSSALEELQMELVVEGLLSIQAGENPLLIKEKIRTFRSDWEEKQAA